MMRKEVNRVTGSKILISMDGGIGHLGKLFHLLFKLKPQQLAHLFFALNFPHCDLILNLLSYALSIRHIG